RSQGEPVTPAVSGYAARVRDPRRLFLSLGVAGRRPSHAVEGWPLGSTRLRAVPLGVPVCTSVLLHSEHVLPHERLSHPSRPGRRPADRPALCHTSQFTPVPAVSAGAAGVLRDVPDAHAADIL